MDTASLARRSGLTDFRSYFGLAGGTIAIQETDANDHDRAVVDTLAVMAGHVNRAKFSPQVIRACQAAGIRDGLSEREVMQLVFAYIKRTVTFVEDEKQLASIFQVPHSKELLITPQALLSMKHPQGDCDDFTMLSCSMLMQWGIPCSFKTVAASASMPTQFTHVYCVVGSNATPFDASHGKELGWETNQRYREMIWPVMDIQGESMNVGLGDEATTGNSDFSTGSTSSGFNWSNTFANLLPGLFSAGEKIALQVTQKPGYQQTGPGGTTSYVAGGNTSGMNIPGLNLSSGSGSLTPILLIAGLGIVLMMMSKK